MRRVQREYARVPARGDADYDASDPVMVTEAVEQEAREQWINVMETRKIREKLRECYRASGVNHREECREFALAYKARIESPDYAKPDGEPVRWC